MVLDSSWNETTQVFGHKGVRSLHGIALGAGIINWLLNGLIWIAFATSPKLLSKSNLHLFYAFAITNSLSGFFTIPTYLNLFLHDNLRCVRWSILIGSSWEIALDRMRNILTLGIAWTRAYAIWKPEEYFFLDHSKVGKNICILAVVWGVADSVFMILEDNIFAIRVHCVTTSSSGPIFHWYFLLSSIFFGILLSFVYFTFICKLVVLKQHKNLHRFANREHFQQINSLTVMVILMVLIFSVLPSCLYIHDMILNQVFFMQWGPIITIGYHMYGILSFFIYNYKHRKIRAALGKFKLCRWNSLGESSEEAVPKMRSKSVRVPTAKKKWRKKEQNLIVSPPVEKGEEEEIFL